MRALILAAVCAGGVVAMAASARASDPAKAGASSSTPSTPSSAKSSSAGGTKAASSETKAATKAASSETKAAAKTAASATTVTAQSAAGKANGNAAVKAADDGKPETLEEIVARVRRRLAMERAPKRNAPAAVAPRSEAPARVTLVWRPYVVWPDELTGGTQAVVEQDSERVTLEWKGEAQ